MDINKLSETIESFAPLDLQEEWDNSGWQLKLSDMTRRILVCLEITPEVLAEAIDKNCDLIVTHHPLIFRGLTTIDLCKSSERLIIDLIKSGISVYSSHTPFD